jgi:hypothetical protein
MVKAPAQPCYKSVCKIPLALKFPGVGLSLLLTMTRETFEAVRKDQLSYATMAESPVYHLVDGQTSRTLCDLPTLHTSDSAGTLMVSGSPPEHGVLCRHCDDVLDNCAR